MNLLLDCGNTRLKWAIAHASAGDVRGGSRILRRGFCDYAPAALSDLCAVLNDGTLKALHFASVVSTDREQALFERLQPLGLAPQRFCVSDRCGTLTNAYGSPDTMGVDRWAAAIGAWGLLGRSCLIVSAGTATTIDLIEMTAAGGVYRGGLIVPGIDMMLQSLHQQAARLPQANGRYRAMPDIADNTHDAMVSGAIDATCGAVERMGRHLSGDAPWLLTGGNAPALHAVLGERVQVVGDLVLEGLAAAQVGHHHSEEI